MQYALVALYKCVLPTVFVHYHAVNKSLLTGSWWLTLLIRTRSWRDWPQIDNSPHVGAKPHGCSAVGLVLADEDWMWNGKQANQSAMLQELEDFRLVCQTPEAHITSQQQVNREWWTLLLSWSATAANFIGSNQPTCCTTNYTGLTCRSESDITNSVYWIITARMPLLPGIFSVADVGSRRQLWSVCQNELMVPRHKLSSAHGLAFFQYRSPVGLEFFGRLSTWSGSWTQHSCIRHNVLSTLKILRLYAAI